MTTVKFERIDGKIVSVECNGHTEYADEGEDVICAALSSIVQTAVLGLMQVAKINIEYKIDEKQGYLKAALPQKLTIAMRHDADIILETLLLGVADLNQGFSDFIELEVK